jgi:hypothetical protein
MRLARTAAPLPRKSGWQESNLRSPASGAGGVASLPYSQSKTPGGIRTRSSGLRARRHHPSTTRASGSGGRARTCPSRLTVARLTDSTTPERWTEAAGFEPAGSQSRLRASNALPFLTRPYLRGRRKERESNPQGYEAHPFSKRDTAPMAVLPSVAPAGVEPAHPRVRAGSSAV